MISSASAPRFAAASRLERALDVYALSFGVASHGGPALARLAAAASPALRDALHAVLQAVDALLPCKVFLCSGFDVTDDLCAVECFNLSGLAWEHSAPWAGGRAAASACWLRGQLYVVGGTIVASPPYEDAVSDATERLDPAGGGSWEALPPLVAPRLGVAVAVLGRALYACGGRSAEGEIVNTVERYSLESGSWECVAPMASPRAFAEAAVLGNRLYICCGIGSRRTSGIHAVPRCLERFSPLTGKWEALPRSSQACTGTAVAAVSCKEGGVLYACGGCRLEKLVYLRSCEKFDTSVGVWRALPELRHARAEASAVAVAGSLIVCGGEDAIQPLRSVERLELAAPGAWASLPSLQTARAGPSSAACFKGLFIFGGVGEDGQALATVEHLAPGDTVWSCLPPMPGGRRAGARAVIVFPGGGVAGESAEVEQPSGRLGRGRGKRRARQNLNIT